jgi:ion channel-forming bestrophin family protein
MCRAKLQRRCQSTEFIAEEMEDPFGTQSNDLPTDAISETLRANLQEILG